MSSRRNEGAWDSIALVAQLRQNAAFLIAKIKVGNALINTINALQNQAGGKNQ
ncbi:hypothetical protein [Dyella solisilvae]|uniref:hypothetical protein n=1 Tax=Dyella solisilvae TaxID=1920168 RepID=UPI0018F2CB89|nr:hypothetical protein [Dyella solisilvae]